MLTKPYGQLEVLEQFSAQPEYSDELKILNYS